MPSKNNFFGGQLAVGYHCAYYLWIESFWGGKFLNWSPLYVDSYQAGPWCCCCMRWGSSKRCVKRYLTLRRHNCQIWKCTKWINGLQRIEQWTSTLQDGSPRFHISRCFPKISMFIYMGTPSATIWYNLWKVSAKMLFILEDYIGRLLFYDFT